MSAGLIAHRHRLLSIATVYSFMCKRSTPQESGMLRVCQRIEGLRCYVCLLRLPAQQRSCQYTWAFEILNGSAMASTRDI